LLIVAFQLRTKIEEFRALLSEVTEAIVNVDGIHVHENSDGSIDKTKTDVLFHFVNAKDNSVMEVEYVLKLIDYRTEELDEVFRDFNVLNTESATASLVSVQRTSTDTVVVLWLVGLCGFLLLLLVLVFSLCIFQRQR
jgi:hypothetical protein